MGACLTEDGHRDGWHSYSGLALQRGLDRFLQPSGTIQRSAVSVSATRILSPTSIARPRKLSRGSSASPPILFTIRTSRTSRMGSLRDTYLKS